ncbi:MAG: hypothetical protein JNL96_08415 [Planctomycetaceae bacterium]|nr:hypothetical protein [Planctomycetaceae bacterium]
MSTPSESFAPASAPAGALRDNSRKLVYIGAGIAFVAFLLPWWGITKYRVSAFRGHVVSDMTMRGEFEAYPPPKEVTEGMDPEEIDELKLEARSYTSGWDANKSLNKDFYYAELGDGYEKTLLDKETMSQSSGSLSLYGWSTWTGWFGVLFILLGVALYAAPAFLPQMQPWAWLAPWGWLLSAAIYLLAAIGFYFGVPDENGPGYSQGVSLGCYLAILGGIAAAIGCYFEGVKSAADRLSTIEAGDDEDEDDDDVPAAKSAKPAVAPKPLDPEEERRRRLSDW